jgi:hypothetical protein
MREEREEAETTVGHHRTEVDVDAHTYTHIYTEVWSHLRIQIADVQIGALLVTSHWK